MSSQSLASTLRQTARQAVKQASKAQQQQRTYAVAALSQKATHKLRQTAPSKAALVQPARGVKTLKFADTEETVLCVIRMISFCDEIWTDSKSRLLPFRILKRTRRLASE